jgi:AraC-like DNA-binding protein
MFEDLAQAILQFTETEPRNSPFPTIIHGLTLHRSDSPKPISHLIYKPSFCVVVQGAKSAMIGSARFDYRAGQALVISLEMPGLGRVVEASPDKPYLGVIIELDMAVMHEIIGQVSVPMTSHDEAGMFVLGMDGPVADCIARIIRLLSRPDAVPVLYPLITREMYYWLLTGPHGPDIARMGFANNREQLMVHAIHTLRGRFAEPVRVEDLAKIAHMSPSTFHRQFKALTLMTPLQYQKNLRLLEARRLMAAEAVNVETAAYTVGYESPSQFSREYSRMFGAPPGRDAAGLRSFDLTGLALD